MVQRNYVLNSTEKCKELRIFFENDPGIYENITIDGNTIDVVKSVKILGVTLQISIGNVEIA